MEKFNKVVQDETGELLSPTQYTRIIFKHLETGRVYTGYAIYDDALHKVFFATGKRGDRKVFLFTAGKFVWWYPEMKEANNENT